jgi:hypothetical protein
VTNITAELNRKEEIIGTVVARDERTNMRTEFWMKNMKRRGSLEDDTQEGGERKRDKRVFI